MKKSLGFAAVIAVTCGGLLPGRSEACTSVSVESMNGAPSTTMVGLTLDSVPAASAGFSLNAGASRVDLLPVGTGSSNPLNLAAHVTMGSLAADCSMVVTQCSTLLSP